MLFLISWRNLWRYPARSFLIMGSVVLGVWAGLFTNAIYFGMGESRKTIAIRHEVSHIQVHHRKFQDDKEAQFSLSVDSLEQAFRAYPEIAAYSLRTVGSAMVANASGSRGITLNGIDPAREQATRPLKDFLVAGDYLDTALAHRVYLSTRLAERMNLEIGNKVVLTMLDTANNIVAGAFRICGLFKSANAPFDEQNAYLLKHELDALLGTTGRAHEAAMMLQDEQAIGKVCAGLNASLPDALAEDWTVISPETALVLQSLDQFAIVFILIILLALAFGIVNTMLMAVLERSREIRMLQAIGMNRTRLFFMVLFETVFLTIAGLLPGLLLAWLSVAWMGRTGLDLSRVAGDLMRSFGYGAVIYPYLPARTVVQTVVLVFITALLSAIFPALRAIKLRQNPPA
jgi:ABC-type lipoprotein release transport system permease subunit